MANATLIHTRQFLFCFSLFFHSSCLFSSLFFMRLHLIKQNATTAEHLQALA